jgi:peptidyl-prolyl cis-trans isomerase B (cyclophilin B)
MRAALACLAALCLLLAGCGGDDDSGGATRPATTATDASNARVPTGCEKVPEPEDRPDGELEKPALKGAPPTRAVIATNCGDITIALAAKDQPDTVRSFAYLAERKFFDGTTFWRVQRAPDGSDFVIQGGDPTNSGTGGPGYSVTEKPPGDTQYTRGTVAMAKTEVEKPGTSGSQFFIVTAEDAGLPPDYAVLGKVVGGEDAVDRIASAKADPATGRATQTAVIQGVRVSG